MIAEVVTRRTTSTCPPSLFGADATFWTLNATSLRLRSVRDTGAPSVRRLIALRRLALSTVTTVLNNLMLGSNSTEDGTYVLS